MKFSISNFSSASVYLPGRRLNHALSDSYIDRLHHYQQYSSSHHQFNSFSDTNLPSSSKEQTGYLLTRTFPRYIELESSNTCLEASTEFTPDFLLTTMNNSKYDEDAQTEQFGIETKKVDCQTDTLSLIIDKKQEEIDTLAFNSSEKENCDSLELDMEMNLQDRLNNDEPSIFNSFDLHQLSALQWKSCRWQLPNFPRRTNSTDVIYERCWGKVQSNSYNGIHFIGRQVRIKSHSSLSHKRSIINYNNNCRESTQSEESHRPSLSTSDDSFSSFDTGECKLLPGQFNVLMHATESGG